MIWGLSFGSTSTATDVCSEAFSRGLLLETSGPENEVVKVMPPLTIDDRLLLDGLAILSDSVDAACDPDRARVVAMHAEVNR
jgi:diaminobutyrate-2-oxoglutarate transaminase